MDDIVYISHGSMIATVGRDCWHRNKPQTLIVSVKCFTNVKLAGDTDDVLQTIHYGLVYKDIVDAVDGSTWASLDNLAELVCSIGLKTGGGDKVSCEVMLPKGLLQAEGLGMECVMLRSDGEEFAVVPDSKVLLVKNLKVMTLIGVNRHEREDKQLVQLNLRLWGPFKMDISDCQTALMPITEHVEQATYLTVEALVISTAKLILHKLGFSKVTVSAQKPNAFATVEGPGVQITRVPDNF